MHGIPDSLDGIPGYDKRQTGARVGRQENRAGLGWREVAVTYDIENTDDQLLFAEINIFDTMDEKESTWQFKWKLLSSAFLFYCLLCWTRWF